MNACLKQSTAIVAPDPFTARRTQFAVNPGLTITQIIAQAVANDNLPPRWSAPCLRVYVGGVEIPSAWWPRTHIKAGQHLAIIAAPQGGGGAGKIFRTLAMVAVVALTAWVGAGALVPLLGSGFAGGTVGAALAAAGVALIGGVILNALFPVQTGGAGGTQTQSFSLQGAKNAAKPYQPMNLVLGKRRVVPPLAAATYTETVGDDVYLRMMVQWHIGPCELSDIKIGETPIDQFEGVEIQHRLLPGDPYPDLYNRIVREEPLQIELTHATGWVQRTTQRNTTTIDIDLAWPTGLLKTDSKGNHPATVQLQVQYRATGDSTWIAAPVGSGGTITVTEQLDHAFRRNMHWDVESGQYDVRIQRVTADNDSTAMADDVYWVAIRSKADGLPFTLDSAAITALRIKSSNQLNGVLDNLNAVVQMHAPLWDSEAGEFSGSGPTRWPGEITNWLALGPANTRPLTDRVDVAALGAWNERCVEKGWKCDYIIDNGSTLDQALAIVAGCGRGFGAMWFDGKLSVAVDDVQDTPVQVFSARNVKGFQGTISFPGALHAVNVQFQDEDNGYIASTRTVFADGYSDENATLYETIDATGKVSAAEAYVTGWRYLAGRLLRPEVYEFDTNLQGLVCRIGQRIEIAHFRMLVGITGARIRELVLDESDNVAGVVIDETVTMEADKEYGLRVQSGPSIALFTVSTVAGTGTVLTFPAALEPAGAPKIGDHAVFGESGKETFPAIVIGIAPKPDMSSHIMAIPYAPGLQADGGEIPDWDPMITPRVLTGAAVGVHVPGGDRIVNDNLVQEVLQQRGQSAINQALLELSNTINEFIGPSVRTLIDSVKQLSQSIAEAAIGGQSDLQTNMQMINTRLTATAGGLTADYQSLILAATGPGSALVTQQQTLTATLAGFSPTNTVSSVVDTLTAQVNAQGDTITAQGGAITALQASVNNPTTGLAATYSATQSLLGTVTSQGSTITSQGAALTEVQATLAGYSSASTVASAISVLNSTVSSQGSAISANSDAITSVNSTVGNFVAGGLFRAYTSATPGDALARIALSVSATSGTGATTAALYMDAMASGNSRLILIASQILLSSGSDLGALTDAVEFVGGVLKIKTAAIQTLSGDIINVGTLNANRIVTGSIDSPQLANESATAPRAYTVGDNGAVDQAGAGSGTTVIQTDDLSGFAGYKVQIFFIGSMERQGGHSPSFVATINRGNGLGGVANIGNPLPAGGDTIPTLIQAFAQDTITGDGVYRVNVTTSDGSLFRRRGGVLLLWISKR